jgi:hypothetical protein
MRLSINRQIIHKKSNSWFLTIPKILFHVFLGMEIRSSAFWFGPTMNDDTSNTSMSSSVSITGGAITFLVQDNNISWIGNVWHIWRWDRRNNLVRDPAAFKFLRVTCGNGTKYNVRVAPVGTSFPRSEEVVRLDGMLHIGTWSASLLWPWTHQRWFRCWFH